MLMFLSLYTHRRRTTRHPRLCRHGQTTHSPIPPTSIPPCPFLVSSLHSILLARQNDQERLSRMGRGVNLGRSHPIFFLTAVCTIPRGERSVRLNDRPLRRCGSWSDSARAHPGRDIGYLSYHLLVAGAKDEKTWRGEGAADFSNTKRRDLFLRNAAAAWSLFLFVSWREGNGETGPHRRGLCDVFVSFPRGRMHTHSSYVH